MAMLTNSSEPYEIFLYGVVANRKDSSDYVDAAYVRHLLNMAGTRRVLVRINSPGGNVSEGISIYNLLKRHRGGVDVIVDSFAASIASVICMAGRTITMARGSTLMAHNPWCETIGDARAHSIAVDALKAVKESCLDIYQERTKQTRKLLSQWLDDELWLDARKAVETRFADSIE